MQAASINDLNDNPDLTELLAKQADRQTSLISKDSGSPFIFQQGKRPTERTRPAAHFNKTEKDNQNDDISESYSRSPAASLQKKNFTNNRSRTTATADPFRRLQYNIELKKHALLALQPTFLGQIASSFYVQTTTVSKFNTILMRQKKSSFVDVLMLLCDAAEYAELPVRWAVSGRERERVNYKRKRKRKIYSKGFCIRCLFKNIIL